MNQHMTHDTKISFAHGVLVDIFRRIGQIYVFLIWLVDNSLTPQNPRQQSHILMVDKFGDNSSLQASPPKFGQIFIFKYLSLFFWLLYSKLIQFQHAPKFLQLHVRVPVSRNLLATRSIGGSSPFSAIPSPSLRFYLCFSKYIFQHTLHQIHQIISHYPLFENIQIHQPIEFNLPYKY